MDKLKILGMLADKVCGCEKCPALVQNRTQTVFASGNPYSKILFLGEAPGKNEDLQGMPFVGRAGVLLDNIINACGWQREDIYVCNILKCRPPSNRTPTLEEMNNCSQYLDFQIKVVNPKFIVCLGAIAAHGLLKVETPIGQMRKQWFEYKNQSVDAKVLCTFHPAYVLRNPKAKTEVWEDLQMLVRAVATLQNS